jgi:hypothetical protein
MRMKGCDRRTRGLLTPHTYARLSHVSIDQRQRSSIGSEADSRADAAGCLSHPHAAASPSPPRVDESASSAHTPSCLPRRTPSPDPTGVRMVGIQKWRELD